MVPGWHPSSCIAFSIYTIYSPFYSAATYKFVTYKHLLSAATLLWGAGWSQGSGKKGKDQRSCYTVSDDLGIFKTTTTHIIIIIIIFPFKSIMNRINWMPFHFFYILLTSTLIETGGPKMTRIHRTLWRTQTWGGFCINCLKKSR